MRRSILFPELPAIDYMDWECTNPFQLYGLPNELLDKIFSHLCPHCTGSDPWTDDARAGKCALANLCRVDKFLKARVQPILYHTSGAGRDFDFFARSLMLNPSLARHVRAVYLSPEALMKMPRADHLLSDYPPDFLDHFSHDDMDNFFVEEYVCPSPVFDKTKPFCC